MCYQDVFQNHTHHYSPDKFIWCLAPAELSNWQHDLCGQQSGHANESCQLAKYVMFHWAYVLTVKIKTVNPPVADHSLGNHGFVLSILVYRGVGLYITRGKWWYCKSLDKMVVPSLDTSIWQSDVIQLPLIEEPQWWNRYFPNCWIPKALVSPFNMTNFERFLVSKLQESTYRS